MGKKDGGGEAEQARADEAARQAKIRAGTKRVGDIFGKNFDPAFFKKQREGFVDYAKPQLQDQYGKAEKELTFALDRGGNLDSSARGQKTGELKQLYDLNAQKIADDALAHETSTRTAVEDARSGLVTTLQATGDATGAANSALTRAAALSQPAAYSPLSQLFSDFTAGLGTQAAQERAAAASGGGYKSRYNTDLFGGAGRVQVSGT